MSRSRLLAVIVSIVLGLGLLLWLIDSVIRLYTSAYWISPLLGQLLLFVIIALLLCLLGALLYYAILFLRPKQKQPPRPTVPTQRADAAEETLRAIRQQVAQIQDDVARQALLERSHEIEESLTRRELRIVVFGTGSAGKTSLVNAVAGRIVGQVGAPMGTTTMGNTYRLRLNGLEREIWMTDTPGILEAGVVGTEREQQARQLAAAADLLLFVIDNDLRKSEYIALRQLLEIGKRSLLVLNKTDLYTESDQNAILMSLRQRVQSLMEPADIIAIAANPQAVTLEDGSRLQPEPEILPLLRRMAAVLRSEGNDLVADNILLQSQQLGEEARHIIDAQRRQQAEKVVERFQWIGAGLISVTPLPVIDLLATAAINAQMVVEIGRVYGCELNIERGKELAISLAKTLVSLGVVRGAIELFSIAMQTNVGTFLVGRAVQGVTAAYLTRIAGKSFIEYFRRNQDWGDGGITEVVQQQFQLNQRDEFVKAFVQEAIARVVQPLREQLDAPPNPGQRNER
ncbi:GTP-binding protein [Oculatella sp. LEGE 06141]|uniref:YcjF family protein n=1 Tax=Oculatella sp. LEGE 06141 TaxID=1828648 RepID=UPI001881A443|nr:GTP-binding protein [Oculatella sp. LEGE 06141]MBE9177597.1 GTP-binding protein [Oculatella sp. LEGE 06141]